MRIVISYHNFVRDFRGSLLLRHALTALGHRVWMTPHWNHETRLISAVQADVVVGCQVAEKSTATLAHFTSRSGLHLVLNSSESFSSPRNVPGFLTYDCHDRNESVISLQAVGWSKLYEYVQNDPTVLNKSKYPFIGVPRFDIAVDPSLRSVETPELVSKYNIADRSPRVLYLSSLLFDESFQGVPEEDMQRFGYSEVARRNHQIAEHVIGVLRNVADQFLGTKGVLLIKKHPWDLSTILETRLAHPRIKFLDQSEYLIPCMDAADFVVHSYSTSAIEAWLLKKPTLAILPEEFRTTYDLCHMKHEIVVEGSAETLEVLRNYPNDQPWHVVDRFLSGRADGRATLRLAAAIHRLRPSSNKNVPTLSAPDILKTRWRHWLNANGISLPTCWKADARMTRLVQWESLRRRVSQKYGHSCRKYVQRHFQYLLDQSQSNTGEERVLSDYRKCA